MALVVVVDRRVDWLMNAKYSCDDFDVKSTKINSSKGEERERESYVEILLKIIERLNDQRMGIEMRDIHSIQFD